MKNRISHIMDATKKKTGIIIICTVLLVTLGTGLVLAAASTNKKNAQTEIYTSNSQVIEIDIPTLDGYAKLGPYSFNKGDNIIYDITAEGSGYNFFASFSTESKWNSNFNGNSPKEKYSTVTGFGNILNGDRIVTKSGKYYLYIAHLGDETLTNIIGKIYITAK